MGTKSKLRKCNPRTTSPTSLQDLFRRSQHFLVTANWALPVAQRSHSLGLAAAPGQACDQESRGGSRYVEEWGDSLGGELNTEKLPSFKRSWFIGFKGSKFSKTNSMFFGKMLIPHYQISISWFLGFV